MGFIRSCPRCGCVPKLRHTRNPVYANQPGLYQMFCTKSPCLRETLWWRDKESAIRQWNEIGKNERVTAEPGGSPA